jgi:hypothetical protein
MFAKGGRGRLVLCRPAHDDDAGADPALRPEPTNNAIRDEIT